MRQNSANHPATVLDPNGAVLQFPCTVGSQVVLGREKLKKLQPCEPFILKTGEGPRGLTTINHKTLAYPSDRPSRMTWEYPFKCSLKCANSFQF